MKNYIPKQAEILKPIKKLTKKGEKFEWESEQWEAFEKIKVIILESIILECQDISLSCTWIQVILNLEVS